MTLIVETGTASATSESYISVADADTYHANLGNNTWSTMTTTEKEQALRRAMAYLTQQFRSRWKGVRTNATQALDWPRWNVQLPDMYSTINAYVLPTIIPTLLQDATAEYALLAAAGDLNPPRKPVVSQKVIGPIKVVYDTSSPQYTRYVALEDMLSPFLASTGGACHPLRRT